MRAAAQFPTHQGYYAQPYQFYYSATNRYCAYDPNTGAHFIHSLKDNRWYPYYPDRVSPTPQYSKPKSRRHNTTAEYQQYEHEYQHGYPNNGQYKSGERGREQMRRGRGEDMLYSAAAKEEAHRSLMEDSNIDMDYYFEDEGVDVRMMGDRSGRSRRPLKESRRHRSQSGPGLRNEKAFTREASRPRESDPRSMPHTNHHTHHSRHGCVHSKQTHGHHFASNQAGVGYEGSDHDSGYMDDFEPISEPRKSMPGVARWLDNTSSEFFANDNWHPYDTEHTAREYIHHPEVRVKHKSQKPHHAEKLTRDHSHQRSRSPSKRLHRQDSGVDMLADELEIEIEIHVDDAPRQRYTSPSPSQSSIPNSSSQTNVQSCGAGGGYDCYYTIPPCPNLPPKEPVTPSGEMILLSSSQELAAPRSIHPAASPTFRQADSVYTPSVAPSRPNHPFHEAYNSPSMLPRAPSPPLSPPPIRSHRTRRSGLGVPAVERERRYPRWD